MLQKVTVKKEDFDPKQKELLEQNKIIVSLYENSEEITIEFADSKEDIILPEVIEEKPSEIEVLKEKVVSLEQALMFILEGSE